MLKQLLMNFSQKAFVAVAACESYGGAVAFQLGFGDAERYKKAVELEKYRQKVVFPKNFPLLPVAIFSVGVTFRLLVGSVGCLLLRGVRSVQIRAMGPGSLRALPPMDLHVEGAGAGENNEVR